MLKEASFFRKHYICLNGYGIPLKYGVYKLTLVAFCAFKLKLLSKLIVAFFGQYPVVNVPIESTAEQIPLGMQIIANTYDDLTALQVAAAWSKAVPTLYQKKKFPAFK